MEVNTWLSGVRVSGCRTLLAAVGEGLSIVWMAGLKNQARGQRAGQSQNNRTDFSFLVFGFAPVCVRIWFLK